MPRKNKALQIKVRIRLTEPMRMSEAARRLVDTVVTGIVPPGIELAFVDWATGKGTELVASGEKLGPAAHSALIDFHAALMAAPRLRVEIVDDGRGEQ